MAGFARAHFVDTPELSERLKEFNHRPLHSARRPNWPRTLPVYGPTDDRMAIFAKSY